MAEITSKKTLIDRSTETIFNFLSDFNNFSNLMPEQAQNWQSTKDTCSFTVSGMGQIALKITEKIPYKKIAIVPDTNSKIPFTFELICLIETISETSAETEFVIIHEMPMMISMMASRPLHNLIDIFGEKLKEYFEKQV